MPCSRRSRSSSVFQEPGIEHALLARRWLGLPQPFQHLVHIFFKSVDVRKRFDVIGGKVVLIAGVTLQAKGQRPGQHRAQSFDHEGQAIALMRAQLPRPPPKEVANTARGVRTGVSSMIGLPSMSATQPGNRFDPTRVASPILLPATAEVATSNSTDGCCFAGAASAIGLVPKRRSA